MLWYIKEDDSSEKVKQLASIFIGIISGAFCITHVTAYKQGDEVNEEGPERNEVE